MVAVIGESKVGDAVGGRVGELPPDAGRQSSAHGSRDFEIEGLGFLFVFWEGAERERDDWGIL